MKHIAMLFLTCMLGVSLVVVGATAYVMLVNLHVFLPADGLDHGRKIVYERVEPGQDFPRREP